MKDQKVTPGEEALSAESQGIIDEVRRLMGFVPPNLAALARDPSALKIAWNTTRTAFLENPLPPLFKERFMALIARECTSHHGVVVRCCTMHRLGLAPAAIVDLLQEKLPSQDAICERLRAEGAQWSYGNKFETIPAALDRYVLLAAVRYALRRDPGGRCRKLLRGILGEQYFNSIMLLAGYAAMQRMWCIAQPELVADDRFKAEYDKLLEQVPELGKAWEQTARRINRRHTTQRERKLMAEIGRQDRIREALRNSERRFRRIVENAPFPLMIYAEDGQVVMLNRAWADLSGWDRRSIPTVQDWMEKAQIDRADWSSQDLEALRGWNEAIDEGEQRIRTVGGQVRRWSFTTAALGTLADGRQAIMRMAMDVTDRRELEDALWDTNRRMSGILDAFTDGFIVMDHDTRFIFANEKLPEVLRLRREDIVGRCFMDVFPNITHMPLNAAVQRCLNERTTEHVEHYSSRVDTFYELHMYPTEEGLAAFIRDIGERKRMEQQLRASERRFRGLFESGMLGIMFANRLTGAVLDCNETLLRITGYSREDLEKGRLNWIKITAPEHLPQDVPASHAVANGPLTPYEKEYIHKDGRRVPVLIGGAPMTPGEDVVMAYVIDRTAEKQAQARTKELNGLVEAVVQSIPGPLLIFDLQGRVMRWNAAATAVFGWTAEEAIGRINPLVPDDMRDVFMQQVHEVRQGRELFTGVMPCVTKSGAIIDRTFKGYPVRDPEGKIIAVMGISQE